MIAFLKRLLIGSGSGSSWPHCDQSCAWDPYELNGYQENSANADAAKEDPMK